jgi:hypothetical protein
MFSCADNCVQGWYSVRREWRKLTWVFLAVAFFFLFAWSMMFYSRIYRFTFIDWPFFGSMTVASFVALLCSTGFAIMCSRNYGKGLAEWSKHDFSFSLFGDEANVPGGTVYIEKKFGNDEFEPDLFPTEVTEKEWKADGDRASIYKVALPDLLREDPTPFV